MITILVAILILMLILVLVRYMAAAFRLDGNITSILYIVIIILFLVWIFREGGLGSLT